MKLDFNPLLNCRSNITSERFLGHYRFIPDSEFFLINLNSMFNTDEKSSFAARFTKIGVPEGRVEGKSRLCNFAIHGNKFRGRWKILRKSFWKILRKKFSARSLIPRIVSSHSLFSGTAARSCSLRRTPAPTRKRWTVRTSSSESLDSGFASSFGTLTSSTAELSKKISFFCLTTEVPISFSR